MEEELFPSKMSVTTLEDIEEERRLFYVALTRAKQKAYLSHVETRFKWGNITNCSPSRFLNEIDECYLDLPDSYTSNSMSGFDMPQQNSTWNRKPRFGTDSQGPEAMPAFGAPRKLVKREEADARPNISANFQADDPSRITVGMQVLHERFGVGKVIHMEGASPNIKATVFFQDSGQKQLLLKFAKLKIVG